MAEDAVEEEDVCSLGGWPHDKRRLIIVGLEEILRRRKEVLSGLAADCENDELQVPFQLCSCVAEFGTSASGDHGVRRRGSPDS